MSLPRLDEAFDEAAEVAAFARAYLPYFLAAYREGADSARLRRAKAGDFSTIVRERLRKKSLRHATLAVGTTKRRLQRLLEEGLDEGWGTQELASNLRKTFDVMSRVRSLRIARTEDPPDVINDGSNATLKEEGHRQKEWSTVIDGQERPTHHAANGQIVGIDDLFTVGGSAARYPGDDNLPPGERISCRCVIVAAGLSETSKRRLGRAFLAAHGAMERRFVVHLRRSFRAQRDRLLARLPA